MITPIAFATAAWLCFPNGICVDTANVTVQDQQILTRARGAGPIWSPLQIDCGNKLVTAYASDGESMTNFVEAGSVSALLCKLYVR